MASELVRQLIDSGIHFGHRVSRWNPKMRPYIYGKRNLIHIIDIRETVKGLLRAKRFIAQTVARGESVLFVGTKRQARDGVREQATEAGQPWVAERWLGGTLTNFRTIRSRLARLEELEKAESDGTALQFSKKQGARNAREKKKIERNLSGVRNMNRLPGALVIVDAQREMNALREARALHIPTICLIDTDSDPDYADIPIPGNDDAIRSINAVLQHLMEAVEEGKRARASAPPADKDKPEAPQRRSEQASPAAKQGSGGTVAASAAASTSGGSPAGDVPAGAVSEPTTSS